jgi:hypothetical protein
MKFRYLIRNINYVLLMLTLLTSTDYFISFFAISSFIIANKIFKNQIYFVYHIFTSFILIRFAWIEYFPETFAYFILTDISEINLSRSILIVLIANFLYFLPFYKYTKNTIKTNYSKKQIIIVIFIILSIFQYLILNQGRMGIDTVNYLKVIFPDFLILFLIFSIENRKLRLLYVIIFILITTSYYSKAGIFKVVITFILFNTKSVLNLSFLKTVLYSSIIVITISASYYAISSLRLIEKNSVEFSSLDKLNSLILLEQIASRLNVVDGYLGSKTLSTSQKKDILSVFSKNKNVSSGKLIAYHLADVPIYKVHASSIGIFGYLNIISENLFLILVFLFSLIMKTIEVVLCSLSKDLMLHRLVKYFIQLSLIYALIGGNLDRYFVITFYSILVLLFCHFYLRTKLKND